MRKLIIVTSLALASFVAASASAQTDPHVPICNVNVSRSNGTTWHFDGVCSGTDVSIGPLSVSVFLSVPGTSGVSGFGSSTAVAQSGSGEPAALTLSGSGDVALNIFCIPPGQYTAQIGWSVEYSNCADGVCGGDPSRIYRSVAAGSVGTVAMPLEAADVGATLNVAVDPTVTNGFTPNVSIAYTFGTYTASNFIAIFRGSSQTTRFFLSGSGTWNLNLAPDSYTVYATVCGSTLGAVAIFTVPPPQTPNGAVPYFDFPEVGGSGGGSCTTPPCANRILASIAPGDQYESVYQEPSPVPGTVRFKVRGKLLDYVTHQPKTGTVYLRLEDPDDTAPYVVAAGDAHSPNEGACATFVGATPGAACQAAFAVQADASGRFEATVTAPIPVAVPAGSPATAAAGNNYQVTASADPAFLCSGTNPCAKSGIFTLWKRLYVEEHHMFAQGSFLNGTAAAHSTSIPVEDPQPFRSLSPGAILQLVHADSGAGEGFYSDTVYFASLQPNGTAWTVITTTPFLHEYRGTTSGLNGAPANVLRDGVGIVGGVTFAPDPTYTAALFASMYVELQPLRTVVPDVPFVEEEMTTSQELYFASRWLEHGTFQGTNFYQRYNNANTLLRLGIYRNNLVPDPTLLLPQCRAADLGRTKVDGGLAYSTIAIGRINDVRAGRLHQPLCRRNPVIGSAYQPGSVQVINGETTAHETLHFWVRTKRTPTMDSQGHCSHERYQQDGVECLLHRPYEGGGLYDGQVYLHYEAHGSDSEYMWIRRETDPLPLR